VRKNIANQPIASSIVTAIRSRSANDDCNLPHSSELLHISQQRDNARLKQRLMHRTKQNVFRRSQRIELRRNRGRWSERFLGENVQAGLECGSNRVYVLLGRCCHVDDVCHVARECVTDTDRRWCSEFFGQLGRSVGVGISDDSDIPPGSSHRVRVPAPHQAGTDYRCAKRRPRSHDAVADAMASLPGSS
jgi:hypothetical protein